MARTFGRETLNAIKITVVLLLLTVVLYPLIVWGISQVAMNKTANGSLVKNAQGQVVGSELIGQQFTKAEYFHGRPSAVAYNAAGSGASNLGPTNPILINGNGSEVAITPGATPPANGTPVAGKPNTFFVPGSYAGVKSYADLYRQENSLAADAKLPADAVTASGSGLDPNISVDNANLQAARVAKARGITPQQVLDAIKTHTDGRDLLVFGEPRINVLQLNLDLDSKYAVKK